MSRIRCRTPLLGLLVAAAQIGGSLVAQERPLTPDEKDRLISEAIQAYENWQPAREAAEALGRALLTAEQAAATGAIPVGISGLDSVSVGPFLLIGDPEHLEWAAQQVRAGWNRFNGITKGSNPFWVEGLPLGYTRSMRPPGAGIYFQDWVSVGYDRASENVAQINGGLRRVLLGPLAADRFVEWSGSSALATTPYPRAVVRNLLESDSPLAAKCYQDMDISSCSLLLDLDYLPSGPEREAWVRAVYPTPAIRLRQVSGVGVFWSGALGMQRRGDCRGSLEGTGLETLSARDQACVEVLAHANIHRVQPVNDDVRADVLRVAVDLGGGSPALERIEALPEDASPRQVLEAAAGQSAEAVITHWVENLSAGSTNQQRLPGRSGLFWASCFAAFALRSTRWRLG